MLLQPGISDALDIAVAGQACCARLMLSCVASETGSRTSVRTSKCDFPFSLWKCLKGFFVSLDSTVQIDSEFQLVSSEGANRTPSPQGTLEGDHVTAGPRQSSVRSVGEKGCQKQSIASPSCVQ